MRASRSTRGAFRRRLEGADRGRWSRQGATRTPASRQPKLSGPGAPIRASLGTKGAGASAGPNRGFAGMSPQRWIGSAAPQGKEPERSVHRGSLSIRLPTPRAGRRRNGGLAVTTNRAALFEKHRSACVSREAQARGSARTPRPAPPSRGDELKAQPARHHKWAAERWLNGADRAFGALYAAWPFRSGVFPSPLPSPAFSH
jgi:hypothetical protein